MLIPQENTVNRVPGSKTFRSNGKGWRGLMFKDMQCSVTRNAVHPGEDLSVCSIRWNRGSLKQQHHTAMKFVCFLTHGSCESSERISSFFWWSMKGGVGGELESSVISFLAPLSTVCTTYCMCWILYIKYPLSEIFLWSDFIYFFPGAYVCVYVCM